MEPNTEKNEPAPAVTWNDVVRASAEAEANRVERDIIEDVIDVKLTLEDLADIARANAADDDEKAERQRKIDDLKSALKDEKAAVDAIDARMRDRNLSVRKGTQSRKAKWIVENIFSTNTVRFIDPITERVVLERPMRTEERQISLPIVSDDSSAKARQLSLGAEPDEVEPAPPASTDMTDPEALLEAARRGDPDPSDETLQNEPPSFSSLGDDDEDDDAPPSSEDES